MDQIEQVIEGKNVVLPDYSGHVFTEEQIEKNAHRTYVVGAGGRWEEDGLAQLTFLKRHGLRPEHKVIDIGCGSLRAGRHLVDYLDPKSYYGVDANHSAMQAGYERELTDAQRERMPVSNLRANDRFNVDFGVQFDMALAQSVFTHVSLNHMRLCLYRLAKVMKPGGVFFASYVDVPEDEPVDYIFQKHPKGRTYFYEKNVFWYHRSDMRWAANAGPWSFRFVGEYGSPQRQLMVAYTREHDSEMSRKRQASQREERAQAVRAALEAGGARRFVVRARRRAARIISPY